MNITFYIRLASKDNKKVIVDNKKLVNIRVRLSAGRGVDIHSKTFISVHPSDWSNETQNYRQRSEIKNLDKKKKQLKDLRDYIEDTYTLEEDKGIISSTWLSESIKKFHNPNAAGPNRPLRLIEFIESFIEKAKTRTNSKTGQTVTYKQQREYARTFYYFKDFCRLKNREYDFKDIDLDFYDEFKNYLENKSKTEGKKKGSAVSDLDNKLATNTIGKKIQTFKIFLNDAGYRGYEVNQAYKSGRFIAIKEESESVYLNVNELNSLFTLDLKDTPGLERVRDLFLVGAWTGLRFGDLSQVDPSNITDNKLIIKQHKTGAKVVIPLHPVVVSILNKYENKLPKVISNQKFNEALKDVAKKAKLNSEEHKGITRGGVRVSQKYKKHELISTHTARRSFATNLYKSGFPAYSIMQITGHQTEAAFLKYIKVTPDEHAKLLEMHWGKIDGFLKVV